MKMEHSLYRGMDQQNLQREYSPSSCIEDINVYISQYIDLSAQAREICAGKIHRDVCYGAGKRENMDIFSPATKAPLPVHVFIHGGYWQELSKDESSFAAPNFLDHDIIFIALDYCLAPEASLSEITDQARRGMMWIYDNIDHYGGDKQNITLSGSSAGGHLVAEILSSNWAAFGHKQCPFKGGTAISGVYDLSPLIHTDINEPLFLTQESAKAASPLFHIPDQACEMIFCYGENETSEFKRQSRDYHKTWQDKGLKSSLFEMAGFNHFDAPLELANPHSPLFKAVLKQISR